MAKDFKQAVEELDLWYDEQKENLSKKYYGKVDESRLYPAPEDEEKKKKKPSYDWKKAKFEFLGEMSGLRNKYQDKYNRIKGSRKSTETRKKVLKIVFFPFVKVLLFLWFILKIVFVFLRDKVFKGTIKFIKNCIKWYKDTRYKWKEYHTFHIKPVIWPYYFPVRRFFIKIIGRPWNKFMMKMQENKKKLIALFNKDLKIVIDFAKKYVKIILNFLKDKTKKIGEFLGKVAAWKKKHINPIIDKIKEKLPKKKE